MEESLKHIDLIDKHITGELSDTEREEFQRLFEKDPEFKKEVEIYERVYSKIEVIGEQNLKEKLQEYYKEYQIEKKEKPRGIYRRLVIYGGSIAATFIIGAVLFFNNDSGLNENGISEKPKTVSDQEIDSLKREKIIDKKQEERLVEENKYEPDTTKGVTIFNDNYGYSFGKNTKRIPQQLIRSVAYPITLEYIFNGKDKLTLYGDASIAPLQLKVVKNRGENYFLVYRNQFYRLRTGDDKRVLEKTGNFDIGSSTDEALEITIKGIDEVTTVHKDLHVYYNPESSAPQLEYAFFKEDGKQILFLEGLFSLKDIKLYALKGKDEATYFIKIENRLYGLDPGKSQPTPMQEISILTNKKTQLFRENRTLSKRIYLSQ